MTPQVHRTKEVVNTVETEQKYIERAVLVGLACHSFAAEQNADEETLPHGTETADGQPVAQTPSRTRCQDIHW